MNPQARTPRPGRLPRLGRRPPAPGSAELGAVNDDDAEDARRELQTVPKRPPTHSASTSAGHRDAAVFIAENAKTSITTELLTRLKLRADTAVLRTAGLPGGYRSRGQLISAAIEAELIRLEAEFNNGKEFPPNLGSFRNGRPLGS